MMGGLMQPKAERLHDAAPLGGDPSPFSLGWLRSPGNEVPVRGGFRVQRFHTGDAVRRGPLCLPSLVPDGVSVIESATCDAIDVLPGDTCRRASSGNSACYRLVGFEFPVWDWMLEAAR